MPTRFLSYPIGEIMPAYGGDVRPKRTPIKSIEQGDSCDTWHLCIENHWGTHVDGPAHFFSDGQKIIDYQADFWVFTSPQVLEVTLEPGELLRWETIRREIRTDADLLMIKSGWNQHRDSEIYWKENPGIHPDVGVELRRLNTAIRAVGVDFISISSILHRDAGRAAHREFLNPKNDALPILLIEDMDLSGDLHGLTRTIVAPLIIEGFDSAPCTIFGEVG